MKLSDNNQIFNLASFLPIIIQFKNEAFEDNQYKKGITEIHIL